VTNWTTHKRFEPDGSIGVAGLVMTKVGHVRSRYATNSTLAGINPIAVGRGQRVKQVRASDDER
jgi:hypothetical protein